MVLKQKNPYWTAKAKEDLKEITKYYKKEISINMAHKLSLIHISEPTRPY